MVRRAWDLLIHWARASWREVQSCRECDHPVRFFDEMCACCGASYPVRIRTAVVVVISLPILLLFFAACV